MPAASSFGLPLASFAKADASDDALFYRPAAAGPPHQRRRRIGADRARRAAPRARRGRARPDVLLGQPPASAGGRAGRPRAGPRHERRGAGGEPAAGQVVGAGLNRDPVLPLPGASRDAARRGSCGGWRRRRGGHGMPIPLPPLAGRRCRYGMGPRRRTYPAEVDRLCMRRSGRLTRASRGAASPEGPQSLGAPRPRRERDQREDRHEEGDRLDQFAGIQPKRPGITMDSASKSPKSSAASIAPTGWRAPRRTAPRAMNPRPAVMSRVKPT